MLVFMRRVVISLLSLFLGGLVACADATPPGPDSVGARFEVRPSTVLLTAAGDRRPLTVVALDADGDAAPSDR